MTKTRKLVPWAGWGAQAPSASERTVMMKKCGKKCFLGAKKSFPICVKNTCRLSRRGAFAAYLRAREYSAKTGKQKYSRVAKRAHRIIVSRL